MNILPSYYNYFDLTPAILGLQTAAVFVGSGVAAPFSGYVADRLGRRPSIFWGSVITLLGVLLQSAAQNTAMFTLARAILGGGTVFTGVGGVVYLTETFTPKYRAWGVGLLNNFYGYALLMMINDQACGLILCQGRSNPRRRSDIWNFHLGVHLGLAIPITLSRHLLARRHCHLALYSRVAPLALSPG